MKSRLLLLVLALQTAWIVATVAVQESKLRSGDVVMLETTPVDPRDFLSGDYVTLHYKISTVPMTLFHGATTKAPPVGTPVFVRLVKSGRFHEIDSASLTPLEEGRDHPVLRGKVAQNWFFAGSPNAIIEVEYGLERYYIHEGMGNLRGKLTVEAIISHSGEGIIKQVYIDGKPYAEAMRGTSQ